jgi:DnaK suppressor protein
MFVMQTHKDHLVAFRAILLAEQKRVASGSAGGLETLTTPDSLALDDQAPILHEQFIALHQRGTDHRKLKLIGAALARVDRGDFGLCGACGEGIPLKRLNVIPWAARCVTCQERLDQQNEPDLSLAA